jgi:ATP-dependent Clp protease ATP-binding subunit ClpC
MWDTKKAVSFPKRFDGAPTLLIKRQTAMDFGAIAGHESYEAMRDKVLDESKRVFKPEFLIQLDDIIVFHQL